MISHGTFDFVFESGAEWISNGKVTVVADCDNWKVTFFINNEKCNRSINMVQSKTYHPVFTVWPKSAVSYQLLETTVDV